jgi:hypothetical protein
VLCVYIFFKDCFFLLSKKFVLFCSYFYFQPSKDEVLIRVRAAGLNHADVLQVEGKYNPPQGVNYFEDDFFL